MRPLRRMGILEGRDRIVNADDAMEIALEEARAALEYGDVPVGAVLVDGEGEIVARDHNRREECGDATAHAEMLVISQRSRDLNHWRLTGHTLVVTLEPCAMCAMAAVWARIDRIVYGAADLKAGAAWSLFNIPQDERLNHRIELTEGVRGAESRQLMEDFFSRGVRRFSPEGTSRHLSASRRPRSRLQPLRSQPSSDMSEGHRSSCCRPRRRS